MSICKRTSGRIFWFPIITIRFLGVVLNAVAAGEPRAVGPTLRGLERALQPAVFGEGQRLPITHNKVVEYSNPN